MSTLRKDLRAIAADGAASSVMVGIGENYLPAFVLALTASQVACGLAATVPLVLGAALQLAAPYFIRRWQSYRCWVVFCAAIQALVFAPLVWVAWRGEAPIVLVFALISMYWATGYAGGPAWNTWVATLVPERIRARYLARRTRLAQLGILLGLVGGGLTLQVGKDWGEPVRTFALLFVAAAVSRAFSARFLAAQGEPQRPLLLRGQGSTEEETGQPMPRRVLAYMLLVQAAVYISGPYFTPYMLCQLRLSYTDWVVLTCTAYVAKVLCLPTFGQVASRLGVHRLLWIGAVAITPVSALWLFSDSFVYLLGAQVFSGVAWAAYELAMLLLFVDAIPATQRVRVLTIYNLGNALAIFAGSMAGAGILGVLGENRHAYLALFALSGLGRLATLPVLARAQGGMAVKPVLAEAGAAADQPPAGIRHRDYQVPAAAVSGPHWSQSPAEVHPNAEHAPQPRKRASLPAGDWEELAHSKRTA